MTEAVHELYRSHWGKPSRRARFKVGEFDIEVDKWEAKSNPEGVNLYATIGASARPLPRQDLKHRLEFFLGLTPAQDEVASPLAALGLYSARQGEGLDHGHTAPSDGPLWSGSRMRTFLVVRARPDFLPALELSDKLHVEFLQAIPIFESERRFKIRHGVEALLRRWEEGGVAFWDAGRSAEPSLS
ncbi:MAG TPA: suppressor of fused domain protein [Actinomycetota bacterium]|nr:suppressor of fused domain protein [Actinomycetota bacterium]